jgi:tRNA(fMet)-specific endonuclease VapC
MFFSIVNAPLRLEGLQFELLAFDTEDAQHAGDIRAQLATAGPYDVLIAGQARAHQLVLVTHNVREFACVHGLQVEDWHAAGPRSKQ